MYILRELFLLTALLLSNIAIAGSPLQIFILHSYSQEYPWTKTQHNAFIRTMRANSVDTSQISTEYLDTKRKQYDEAYASRFYSYLQDKYVNFEPDIIYVTDDNALLFALDYFNHMFRDAPIIFSGVNNYSVLEQLDTSRITGVFERKEISPNLQLLKQIQPDLKNIVLVGDASNTYYAIEKEIKSELRQHPDITASFVAHDHIEPLLNSLSEYHDPYIFLTTLGGMTNTDGQILTLENTISLISQARNSIIFSMEDAYLLQGVLGGYVTSGKSQGKAAANLALNFFNGKAIKDIPIITQSPNEYIFDYRELEKNSISLPESIAATANILHQPPSFYERNRVFILFTIISLIMLLMISMALFLIILSRKNLNIQAAIEIQEKLVERINEHAKQLESEQHKLNQAQSIAHIGNYSWEVEKNVTTWSNELYNITGQKPENFIPSYENYVKCIHPDDRTKFMELTRKVLEKKGHYSEEYRLMRPDGEIRFIQEEGEVIVNRQNKTTSLVGVIHDVTDQLKTQAEQERLHRELTQARKMEALGKLTGGIAHDFNNMLAIIIGYTDLAMDRFRDKMEPAMKTYLNNIEQASLRAKELISKMMVFSRSDKNESEPLDLNTEVKESVEMLRSIIPSSIKMNLTCENNLPKVIMDRVQLQQILINLCVNAKDAMQGKGLLNIHLGWRRELENECIACHKHISGDWVELTVSDSGCGMSVEVIERIFEPFFTTKEVGLGTGMGLSILHAIVDSHHGHILLDTELNKGTSFHILFPPVKLKSEIETENNLSHYTPEYRGAGEHIVIVDDETALTKLLTDLLENHGYNCTAFNRSSDALEYLKKQSTNIDLLITDQTMPEITGVEIITQLLHSRPGIPVILMTGFSELIDKRSAERMGVKFFINKPVDNTRLLEFVFESMKK